MRTEYKGLRAMPTVGVCFDCRKCYSRIHHYNNPGYDDQGKPYVVRITNTCPDCKQPLSFITSSMQIPKKSKKRAWEKMREKFSEDV